MFTELRKPFLLAAFITCIVSLLLQLGSAGFLQQHVAGTDLNALSDELINVIPNEAIHKFSAETKQSFQVSAASKPPGLGISYLSLLEMLIIFSLGLMLLSLVVGAGIQGRLQGILGFFFSLLIVSLSIFMIFRAIAELTIMISLFLAMPFGTLVYLGVYGSFNTALAQITLSLLLLLKLALVLLLLLAHQRFVQNKGLVFLMVTAFVAVLITTLLHVLVPGILASITDAVAAIVTAILALIWAIFFLVFSLLGILRALRLDRV